MVDGTKVQAMRARRGLTGQALAEAVGVSNVQISRIERGHSRPSRKTAEKIAEVLGCRLEDLRDGSSLSDYERDLLAVVRVLSDTKRARLLGYAEGLRDGKQRKRNHG